MTNSHRSKTIVPVFLRPNRRSGFEMIYKDVSSTNLCLPDKIRQSQKAGVGCFKLHGSYYRAEKEDIKRQGMQRPHSRKLPLLQRTRSMCTRCGHCKKRETV